MRIDTTHEELRALVEIVQRAPMTRTETLYLNRLFESWLNPTYDPVTDPTIDTTHEPPLDPAMPDQFSTADLTCDGGAAATDVPIDAPIGALEDPALDLACQALPAGAPLTNGTDQVQSP